MLPFTILKTERRISGPMLSHCAGVLLLKVVHAFLSHIGHGLCMCTLHRRNVTSQSFASIVDALSGVLQTSDVTPAAVCITEAAS